MEGKTILLVEDNPDHQELTRRALAAADIFMFTVILGEGPEALEFLHAEGAWADRDGKRLPALMLLDLKLGASDGVEILRRVRQDARTKMLPVVLLTSSSSQADISRAYAAGANGYVVKPVDFDEYSSALRAIAAFWLDVNVAP
ncbi:MAG: response regulator [Planctomycetes bacterium]|nr:response regulator [Planctomycetota bacterium]